MSTRYPGGFINRSAPVVVGPVDGEGGSAPGVWTLEQAGYYKKQGTWPAPYIVGALWGVGSNTSGQLGQNDQINRSSPVQVGSESNWVLVSDSMATKTDGSLWAWGVNQYGQLGLGDVIARSSPVQVGALTNWQNPSTSSKHSASIKTDGSLWVWGRNPYGQLGLGDAGTTNKSSPVQLGSETNWRSIFCSTESTYAIKTDGTLWSWGLNSNGQLGQNLTYLSNVSSPIQVGSSSNWKSVAGYERSATAIKTDGTLWAWGQNNSGTLGQNNVIYRSSPVQVGALTTWSEVSTSTHVLAVKTDGTLWAWGANDSGQLGQNDVVNRSSPVQIGSILSWKNVSAPTNGAYSLKTDGTLWAWGQNGSGQLGQNDVVNKSSPVQIGALTGWKKITRGRFISSN